MRGGVVVTSAGLARDNLVQGADAAMRPGVLGSFWAIIYFGGRSVAAPIVSHAASTFLSSRSFSCSGGNLKFQVSSLTRT